VTAAALELRCTVLLGLKAQLEGGAADVFGPGGGNGAAPAAVELAFPAR
jgi:hypothetical protein